MDSALGDYLRARRAVVSPADVGIDPGLRPRRVQGLRREEVAQLAGISPEYYLRLEQGRERHPSSQVITGLARALSLDVHSERYLRGLVDAPSREAEPVADHSALIALLNALGDTPAFAHDRLLNVIVANPLAVALYPGLGSQVNLVRSAFLDPALRALYLNIEDMSSRLVAYLRAQAAVPPVDPALAQLVDDLSAESPEFARMWSRHDVAPSSRGVNNLLHPVHGRIDLHYDRLTYAGSTAPVIVIYHGEPGSATEAVLHRLSARLRD